MLCCTGKSGSEGFYECRGRRTRRSDRWLIALGAIVALIGLCWPWLSKLGFGKLPGDIMVERNSMRFYFPITSSIVISIIISVMLLMLRK